MGHGYGGGQTITTHLHNAKVTAALNRRRFLALAGGAVGSAILAACGGSSPADKTIDDVQQEIAKPDAPPPPWFTANGGMDGLKPGGAGAAVLDLVPGKYVAVDVAFSDEKAAAKVFTVK